MIVEVCANSLESALNAVNAGASRIELCTELAVGGITPSYGLLQKVREAVNIPVHVLIRPRSGDFTYTAEEFEIMCLDIETCVRLGFDGVVSGVLKKDLDLDVKRTIELLSLKGSLHFTFHRAFDWLPNPLQALGELEAMGVQTLLSSGQQASALQGLTLLKELDRVSTSCTIMPGAGIQADNAIQFKKLGFKALHLSAAAFYGGLSVAPPISMISAAFLSDNQRLVSRESVIRSVVESVK